MGNYILSSAADKDVDRIYNFTVKKFGINQARKYLFGLEKHLELLAQNPYIGISINKAKHNYLLSLYVSHTILYKVIDEGIYLARVLHKNRDIKRHI